MRPSFFHFLLTLLVLSTSFVSPRMPAVLRVERCLKRPLHSFRWDLVPTVPVDPGAIASLIIGGTVKPQETYAFHKVYGDDFQRRTTVLPRRKTFLTCLLISTMDGSSMIFTAAPGRSRPIHGFFWRDRGGR